MNPMTEAHIADAEERLRQAMLHSDTAVLSELIAPELVFTTHLGQVIGKEDDLAFHRSGVFKLQELAPSGRQILLYPGFAIVSVLMQLRGSHGGEPVDLGIRYTRVWSADAQGRLQVVAGHASAVAPA